MAMNWVGGSRARTKSRNASTTIKRQKGYFAKARAGTASHTASGLAHAQFPTSIVEAGSLPNTGPMSITLKHTPFSKLHQLEKEYDRQERQALAANNVNVVRSRSVAETVASDGMGVDAVQVQDEEDRLARKVARRKKRELLKSIGERDHGRDDPTVSVLEKRKRTTHPDEGYRSSSVAPVMPRAGETFAEKRRRLLEKSDWLGLSTLPKPRNRPVRSRQSTVASRESIDRREETEDIDEQNEYGGDGQTVAGLGALPARERVPSPSAIGNQSLLIEVGNKRVYTDRRGNNEVELINQESDIGKAKGENAQSMSVSPGLLRHAGRSFSSNSCNTVTTEELAAHVDAMVASATDREKSSLMDSNFDNQYNQQREKIRGSGKDKDGQRAALLLDGNGRRNPSRTSQFSNSTDSQLNSFISELNYTPRAPTEDQDSVFVELSEIFPAFSDTLCLESQNDMRKPMAPITSGTVNNPPKESKELLLPQTSSFFGSPSSFLSTITRSRPLDSLALLEARGQHLFTDASNPSETLPASSRPSTSASRRQPSRQDETGEDTRTDDFWDLMNQHQGEDPVDSMIAEPSMMNSKEDVEGEDEWFKFLFP